MSKELLFGNGHWRSDTWLDQRLERLNAVYQRFGREGLREFADAHLLLWSKQMQLRDGFKAGGLGADELTRKQRLELEVKDLSAYLAARQKGRQAEKPEEENQMERQQGG